MNKRQYAIGVDIGGSHISSAAIDLERRILLKDSFSEADVDNKGNKETIINSWAATLQKTINFIGVESLAGIGFAMPGPFNYETGVAMFERVEKFESLYGVDVGKAIRESLNLDDDTPVRFMNDATSFAVGEAWMGKADGFGNALAITLGTGFGSAFVKNGIPVVNGETVPEFGCVWHLPFKEGIADDYISTRWFIKSYKNISGKDISGVKEVAEAADSDPKAKALFETYGKSLGTILLPWLKKFGVEIVVMGGNITAAYSIFGPYFEQILAEGGLHINVEISELKENAAFIGSARLVEPNFWSEVKNLVKYM